MKQVNLPFNMFIKKNKKKNTIMIKCGLSLALCSTINHNIYKLGLENVKLKYQRSQSLIKYIGIIVQIKWKLVCLMCMAMYPSPVCEMDMACTKMGVDITCQIWSINNRLSIHLMFLHVLWYLVMMTISESPEHKWTDGIMSWD